MFFMKFYNRQKELTQLAQIRKQSQQQAQMTVVMGRRRIGKTQLLLESVKNQKGLYFFVARKAETLLCQDFVKEIEQQLAIPILGEVQTFAQLFEYLMRLSANQNFTLIIDEFQDFNTVNASLFSEMQRIWDLYHTQSKMNLILCGSVYTLMKRIFQDAKEPLFGRASQMMHIKPFEVNVLKEMLQDYNPNYTSEDLLALYAFTGGVAKYIQLLLDGGAITKAKMTAYIVREESLFLTEGKNLLVSEFGKDYAIYFSILSAISEGKTTRNEIETLLNREIGGYLTRLEKDYALITKQQPLLTLSRTKQIRYAVPDPFLRFWFRFMYKYGYLIEVGNLSQLKAIIERDYNMFSGIALEHYFTQKLKQQQQYSRIGGFWDRKGENEIDIIAVDEAKQEIVFSEVKRQKKKIDETVLQEKAQVFLNKHKQLGSYSKMYNKLSLEDM